MAENVRPSFDQHHAKHGEHPAVKAARLKYEDAVKKLAPIDPASDAYKPAREAKRSAAAAHTEARQEAEARYYAEQIQENKEQLQKMKESLAAPVKG